MRDINLMEKSQHPQQETNLKTFNSAKLYVEQILFELMKSYQNYLKQSDFGSQDLIEANLLNEEIRDIQRYNGLKAMNDITYNLITTIKSTILLKNNNEEIRKMDEIITTIEKLKNVFYSQRIRFFKSEATHLRSREVLNRDFFESIKKIIVINYSNIEILMTRNKLLFADSKDEFASDEEIKDEILKRYVEG